MKATFWGVRGSIPVPGRQTLKYGGNSSCVQLELDGGEMIIFDAGTGIVRLGQKLMRDQKHFHINLFLSHGHMDHVHGFPFFAPAYIRKFTFTIAGCSSSGDVKDFLKRQMGDIYFPVVYDGMSAEKKYHDFCDSSEITKIGKARIRTFPTNHPGSGVSYKITEKGKTFVYMTDNELNSDAPGSMPFDSYVGFVKDADLLIHDTQYSPQEYKRTKGWGHSTYLDVAELAAEANVKTLAIFHHDPDHTDAKVDWMLQKTREELKKRGGKARCIAAREQASVLI